MKDLVRAWNEYVAQCSVAWEQEKERAKEVNEHKLRDHEEGFEFPQRNHRNTPTFEGFMAYLAERYHAE